MNFWMEIPERVHKSFEQAKKYYGENTYIKNLQTRYNNIEGKLQFFEKEIVKKQLLEIKQFIMVPPIKKKIKENSYEWKDERELHNFIDVFSNLLERLLECLKLFNDS